MRKYMIKQIYPDHRVEDCCEIEAKGPLTALKMYAKGLTSSGERYIESGEDGPHLYTSYGAEFIADCAEKDNKIDRDKERKSLRLITTTEDFLQRKNIILSMEDYKQLRKLFMEDL